MTVSRPILELAGSGYNSRSYSCHDIGAKLSCRRVRKMRCVIQEGFYEQFNLNNTEGGRMSLLYTHLTQFVSYSSAYRDL